MTPISQFTEDTLAQQTTVKYLETHLDWDSVYAYNTETFGPDGTLGRDSDKELKLGQRRIFLLVITFNQPYNSMIMDES